DHRYARAADARADLLAPPAALLPASPALHALAPPPQRQLAAANAPSVSRIVSTGTALLLGVGTVAPRVPEAVALGLLGVLSLAIFVAAGVLALGPSFARGDGDDSVRG